VHLELCMVKFIILFTLLPFSLLGQNPNRDIRGVYVGRWATTQWTYVFAEGNIFTFNTAGHFGFTNTMGKYHLSGDTIFLKSFPKEQQKDTDFLSFSDTLIIDGDSCIIDLSLGYDYCKGKRNEFIIHESRQRIAGKSEARKPDE
jgi:hypothetical protein